MNVGVQESVPLVFPAPTANDAPAVMAVPEAVNVEIAWASGSFAETVNERSEFSFTEAVAGAVTTGGLSVTPCTVICVAAEPELIGAADVALNVTV